MVVLVHHLNVSQSERVPWLCEELSIPYELKTYKRAPLFAPPEYKALHPIGSSPVINDGKVTLAESGACVEYLAHIHGGGKLFLPPSHPEYPTFLYWWHTANGSLQAGMSTAMRTRSLPADNRSRISADEKVKQVLKLLNEQVGKTVWLAGKEFTVADIMAVFSLTTMRYFYPVDLTGFDGILGYLKRVAERPAYKRAMEKSDPDMELVLGAKPPAKEKRLVPLDDVQVL
ncbi:hypothetical protein PQX77_000463 [Marasmius sp. AFHP31]|nr:hypothetical protein PQX77_000463 [Marasmius sp. AFHP31]